MLLLGMGDVTYILLSAVTVLESVTLSGNVELQPADTSHLDLQTTLSACSRPDDIAVAAAFIPRTTAQLRITAPTPIELAAFAWNALWDAMLLSAFLRTEIGFNLQSDTAANRIAASSMLRATNYHMRGLTNSPPHHLTADESQWLSANLANARRLLENERFQSAVHCLATFRWHTMPRVQMAILWAGIEGIFGASSEIRFRISLYIARFLQPDDPNERQKVFRAVKKLYDARSAAVHGATLKDDIPAAIDESAGILCKLLRQCTAANAMPDENELAP